MFYLNIGIYVLSFLVIWLGAGLIIRSVDDLSKRLRISAFAISFFVLGLFTSIPEFAVGLAAVSENKGEIFVGNLLGGVIVLFLLVIPVLAILGRGIKLSHQLNKGALLLCLVVVAAPSMLVIDRKVTNAEGIFLIILYFVLFYIVQRSHGILDSKNSEILSRRAYSLTDILKVIVGISLVFFSSNIIVDKTVYFAQVFEISPFFISLLFLSLGTNLPELSIAVRSIISGKKDIAFGDYLGSSAANTLLFGSFTLVHRGEVLTESRFFITFIFILLGLVAFYYFSRSRNDISKKEGVILLIFYFIFVFLEFVL